LECFEPEHAAETRPEDVIVQQAELMLTLTHGHHTHTEPRITHHDSSEHISALVLNNR